MKVEQIRFRDASIHCARLNRTLVFSICSSSLCSFSTATTNSNKIIATLCIAENEY